MKWFLCVILYPFLCGYSWCLRMRLRRCSSALESFDQSKVAKQYHVHKQSVKSRAKLLEPAIVFTNKYFIAVKRIEDLGGEVRLVDPQGRGISIADLRRGRVRYGQLFATTRRAKPAVRDFFKVREQLLQNLDCVSKVPKNVYYHLRKHRDAGSTFHILRRLGIVFRFTFRSFFGCKLGDLLLFCKGLRDLDREALEYERRYFLGKRHDLERCCEKLQGRLSLIDSLFQWLQSEVKVDDLESRSDGGLSSVTEAPVLHARISDGPCLPYAIREKPSEETSIESNSDQKVAFCEQTWTFLIWKNGPETELVLPLLSDRSGFIEVINPILREVAPVAVAKRVYDCLQSIPQVPVVERG